MRSARVVARSVIAANPKNGRRGLKSVMAPLTPRSKTTTLLQMGHPTENSDSNKPPIVRRSPAPTRRRVSRIGGVGERIANASNGPVSREEIAHTA